VHGNDVLRSKELIMNTKQRTHISKFLSLVLRHEPQSIGLTLDSSGWASVDDLLARCNAAGEPISREQLDEVVATNEKKRFAFSEDGARIRASQGHSVAVELGYAPAEPPEILYHGTAKRFLPSIKSTGLNKGDRHHVHLSATQETAKTVGDRHGPSVVLTIRSGEMRSQGHLFFISDNQVWLTDHVPLKYIHELGGAS
jgi:putative RNA 2'-phosphotransferase